MGCLLLMGSGDSIFAGFAMNEFLSSVWITQFPVADSTSVACKRLIVLAVRSGVSIMGSPTTPPDITPIRFP